MKKGISCSTKTVKKIKNQDKNSEKQKEEESIYIPLELTHNQRNFHYKS
jgi:hypothetical protein